jgi:seryl-tRNA synthetase
MLDLKFIRESPDTVKQGLADKKVDIDIDQLLALDTERRGSIAEVELLKEERNKQSKSIGGLMKGGKADEAETLKAQVRELGEQIDRLDARRLTLDAELETLLLSLPNLAHASVPVGADETANPVIRIHGQPSNFEFEARPHWDLGEALGIIDFKRTAKISGSGFPTLIGAGSQLSRGLVQFMLDLHTTEHGYTEVLPPFLVNSDAVTGTGQLPKFPEEMYRIEADDLWLIPTAEVPLTNLYRDEIIPEALPIYLTGYTPCFRREAGAAGKMTRGMNRVHQFDKVEMVKFVEPETSYDELEKLTGNAEAVLKKLGLHYRVIELCTGDLSFASAKTYDIELWAPGQDTWLEVSSCSNFESFQARRASIRYRNETGKAAFVHTLNGSGVALPRLIVAIMEQYQQADGSIAIPEALRSYVGGRERIG